VLIDVAISPGQKVETAPVTVVIDTLRACTSITTLHERGVSEVLLAPTIADGRKLKTENPRALLCGEENGLPPEGFDYGNSPSEFATLDLAGEVVILATSNGTPLLRRHAAADVLLVGCLRNARAVTDAAAGPDRPVLIACAGVVSSGEPAAEDSFTAGAIVNHLIRIHEGFQLSDAAQEAFENFLSHEGDPSRAFANSSHAEYLRSIGFMEDLAFCSEMDSSTVVSMVEGAGGVLRALRLRA
jgi:2-phosphosulfolactate phosphatase